MQFFLLLALILTILFVILAIQNPTVITLTFITWTFSGPLTFILALIFAAGILGGTFLFIPTWWRKVKGCGAQKRRIQELERELLSATEQKSTPESNTHSGE